MLEMSAAKSPALALTGAAMPAVPAVMSVDGAQFVDFSMVLAGATLASDTLAPLNDMLVQPEADTPPAPELLPHPATLPGKSGTSGNINGKNLPAGKLAAPRAAAVAEKAPRKQPSESVEAKDASSVTALERDAASTAGLLEALPVESSLDDLAPTVVPAVIVAAPQSLDNEAGEKAQQTFARTQPRTLATTSSRGAVDRATAKLSNTPVTSERADKGGSPVVARPATPANVIAPPDHSGPALVATPPSIGNAATAPIVDVPATAGATIETPQAPVRGNPELEITARNIPEPARAPLAAILAQATPIASVATTLASSASAMPIAAPVSVEGAAAAREPASLSVPVQSVQANGASAVSLAASPMPAHAAHLEAADSQTPAPQDRSLNLIAASEPARTEAAVLPARLATADQDHKAGSAVISSAPIVATEAAVPFVRAEMDASTLAAEFRSAPTPAAPTISASATPSTPTQDIAALVDRITEARAAASPHTIRASLVHEDFGAVSVNLRTEASHIHVTLGNADPGFAPAVQAAAAASLASNGDDANARREAAAPQSFTPTQDTSARADTSSQQQTARDRAPAPERTGGREATGRPAQASAERDPSSPASRRRGGIYA